MTNPADLPIVVSYGGGTNSTAAWGTHAQPNRALDVRTDAELLGVPLHHLGLNKGGSPKHPLYLPLDTEPQEWVL